MTTTRNVSTTTSNSTITVQEILETLNAEQFVDLAKLRGAARYGLSSTIRGVSGKICQSKCRSSLSILNY